MKKIVSVLFFSLSTVSLSALPEGVEISSGQADLFVIDDKHLRIKVSDQAILRHKNFHIKEGEFVEFVQPSSKSTVLNRVVGQDASHILGKLSSNGRVFLINPNGICFGPNAVVNTGSFLASTLNIRDEDFLNGEFKFFLEPGSENSKILNEGTISVAPDGFAAFFSPFIENRGSILAKAGRVVLASAEKVTVDFSGDGLIQFAVEGELERALIESSGDILAADGLVNLSMRSAHRAIKMVVNTEGITPANHMEEVEGVIRLVSRSRIAADSVRVDGGSNGRLDVQGSIDASHPEKGGVGGSITLLGDQVGLWGANLDASGDAGGGEILAGGNYQGKGPEANATWTIVDEHSLIRADAYAQGNGGRVIVWADETAVFDGQIFARGGGDGGDGGFVETSGEQNLSVTTGNVNTLAPKGRVGSWLMDPSSITIVRNNGNQGSAGLTTAATCSGGGFNLNDTTINNAASTVVLCTAGLIRYNNGAIINITTAGVGITHGAASTPSNTTFQTGGVTTWSITTNNGPLTFNGPVTIPSANTMSFTTSGGNVTFANTINGAGPAVINAGAGTTTFTGAVGATTALTSLTVTAGTITQSSTARTTGAISYTGSTAINVGGNMTTAGGTIGLSGPVTISGNPTIDSTNAGGTAAGATITFSNTLNGATALTLRAGTAGNVIFTGVVGGTAPPTNISFTSAAQARIGNNITVSGANPLNFSVPVLVTGTSNITSNNANVTFGTTLNGSPALTITGGSGTTTFTGAVGGTTPLASLSATAATITQSSTATTVGALSYTGSTAINVSGNITTAGGTVGLSGPVSIAGAPTIDTTNAGGTPAGATITFSSTLNGATTLALRAGTGGNVIFTGAVGGTAPPTNITFTSAAQAQIGNNFTVSGANPLNFSVPVLMTGTSTVTSNNANVTFGSTLNGAAALSVAGGSGITTFTGAVGATTPLTSLSATAATVTQSSSAKTTGAISYSGSTAINVNGNMTTAGGTVGLTGPVTISGSPTIDTTNAGGTPAGGTVTFSSTLNGATALTLQAGTAGNVIFTGIVGGSAPPTNIVFTSGAQVQIGNNITVSGANPLNISIPALLTGTSLITSNNANVTFGSTLNGALGLTVAGGSGTTTLTGAVGATTPLSSLSITAATITQSSTAKTTGAISYSGSTAINLGGNLTTSGSTMGFTGPVNITSSLTADATNGGAVPLGNSISFSSTIDGAVAYTQDLTLRAGTSGNITFTGAVGGTIPLRNLTITSVNNWTAAAMTTASILQSAGSGTTTFNGAINTNGTAGIVLTGNVFNWNANITTTNTGPLSVTHTGTLTIGAGVTLNIDGPYSDLGPGATVYSGGFNIITNGSNVTFSNAVNLNGASSVNTGAGVGDILFNSTVNGAQNLTLLSGLGNIVFSGGVGQTTPLNILSITSANNVTAGAVSAVSFAQAAGTGTTTFNGAVALSGASGFAFTGNNLTINSTLSTALGGPANISVAGTFVLGSSGVLSLDGAFTQSGAGVTQSAGSITTTNDTIQFGGVLVLTGNTILNTGAGIGNINLLSTVEGTGGLTLTAGTGNITFTGAAGGSSRLGALLINSATNINTAAVTANSINIASFTGTATLNGAYNTNGASGIQITGNAITRSGTLTTTGGGPCTFTNGGTLTSTGNMSVGGALTQNGAGLVSLEGTLATANGNISFLRAITETGALTLDTGSGVGNITLSSTVDGTVAGAQSLTLAAGTGTISLNGNLGAGTRLGAVTINSASNVTASGSISANSLSQLAGTGTTTFNGAITTTAVGGVSLSGTAFTINSSITTTGAGPMIVANAGLLTISSGDVFNLGGAFTQNGVGATALSGSITSAGTISFATGITVSGTAALSTAAAGTNISLLSTVDGGGNLTLASGAGSISVTGNMGGTTRLGALVFSSANNITVPNITAGSITQSAGTGTTTIGNLNTNAVGGISLTGTAFAINGNLITTNLGPVAFVNSGTLNLIAGASTSITGAFSQSGGGAVSLAGTLLTANQNISFAGPITLTSATAVNTGAGIGDITFSGTVNGAFSLALTAGTGNITASSAIGGVARIGTFTVNSGTNMDFDAITSASINITETGGTLRFHNNINTNTVAGITLNAATIVRSGSITATNGGPLIVTFSGTSTSTGLFAVNVGSVDITSTGVGAINFGGSVTTDTGGVAVHTPVVVLATATVDTSGPGGDIHFFSTLNGAQNVTLTAGAGNIFFDGVVGGTTPLSALLINSAHNVTAAGAVSAASIVQAAGTGTSTFSGALTTTGATGISITTASAVRGAAITTTGTGPLTFSLSPGGVLTSTAAGAISLDGAFTETGAASVFLSGSITTTNDNISFSSPITLAGTTTLNSGSGAGNISVASIDGAQALNITAGTGDFTASGDFGNTTRLGALTVNSCTNFSVKGMTLASLNLTETGGTSTFNGILNTNTAAGITINAGNILQGGGVTATNGGPLTISFSGTNNATGIFIIQVGSLSITNTGAGTINFGGSVITDTGGIDVHSPISFIATTSANTSGPGGNIHFFDTVNGANNITLAAGTGNILFDAAVGGVTPPLTLTFSSANNVTAAAAVSAAAIVQTAGTGKTTFSGAVSTTTGAGISLTGSQFEINGAVTTTNGGPLLVNNSGAFTFSGGGTIAGAFTQTGAGAVSLAGTTTAGGLVAFAAPVTLTGTTSLDTSANASSITFSGTVNGGQNLSLNLGAAGDLTFTGSVGGSTRLGALTIVNVDSVTAGSITAASIIQTAGSGTSTLGSLNTNAVGGISLTGTAFSINGNLITTNLGPVAITNTGALVLVGGASTSITGAFSQSGGGAVGLAGLLLTANQNLSFANAITLLGTTSLSTGAGAGTITLSSTVNGSQNLTLNAGTGNIVLGGAIGGTTALGALTVQSCTNITYPATAATSVTQAASSGTTTLSSTLTTTGTSGISLTGTTITQSSTLASSGNGPIAIINSGTYTMGGTVNAGGSFTQSGGGSVQLNGGITSSAGSISLANAITLTGSSSLSTNTGLGSILISSTIDGANNLSLTAGGGTITLSGAVGGGTRLVAFTINSGTSNTTGAITAASISQLSGSTTFGALNTNAVLGISLIGTSFTLGGNVTTTASGPVSIQNTGALVLSGPTFSIAGAFTQAGAGTTTLSSAITAGGAIQFGGPITASGGSLSTAAAGANISLLSTVDGGGDLTLDAGSLGDITIAGNVGSTTRLGALVLINANNVTVQNITAASVHQVDGQGTTSGLAINTNGIGGVVNNGNNFIRNGSVVTTNGGPVHLTNRGTFTAIAGTSSTVDGQYLQDGSGSVLIQGSITTNNQPISFAGPITLIDAFSLDSGAGAGDITFSNTVDGAFNLTLTAGTGSITASSPIGGVTRIGAFTVNSCTNFTGTGLTAASVSITETGGTVQSNGNINTNTAAGIVLNAQNIVRGGSVTATNGGPLTVTFSGTSTATGVFPISVGSLSITSTGVGAINFGGSVTTDTGGVDLNSPVNLQVPSSVNTSGPGGTIHFHSTVNGAQNLTLTAGAGNVLFDGVVGGTTPLSALLINSANNVIAAEAISAASIVQAAGTGTSTFNGALTTTGATGISITTASVLRGAAITTTGTGPLTFALSSGGTLISTAPGAISLDGAFTETGAALVALSGSIITTNDNISFASPITLTGTTTLNSGSGAGNISVASIDGAQALNITAGIGDFTASGDFGNTTRLGALTVNSCTNFSVKGMTLASLNLTETGGTSTFNGILNTNTVSGITINAGNIVQGGSVTATNGGPLTISFSGTNSATGVFIVQVGSLSITKTTPGSISFGGSVITDTGGIDVHSPINFLATTSANTSGPGANIHFFDTVNGAHNITLAAGTGNILFDAAVGGVAPPLTLTFSSANNVTAAAAVSAAAIVQTAGTGKTTFSGAVSTTTGAGISLTGSQFEIDGAVTTAAAGPLAIAHTGLLTIGTGAAMSLDGSFSETGGGSVSLGANITTTNDAISWADPITLTHDVILNTGAGGGNISFANTINGPYCLTLLAGTGQVQFSGAVGSSSPLNCVSATGATIIQSSSVQTLTTVDYTGFMQIGGGIITNNSAITLTGNVQLTGSPTLTTGAGLGNISITGTVNGDVSGRSLTLAAGTGNVTVGGVIGNTVSLNNLTLSGDLISWAGLGSGGVGATGTASLNAASSITFTGTNYNNGSQLYTAGTSFIFNNAATLTSNNLPITFTTGTIELGSGHPLTINSNGGNITLTDLTVTDVNATNLTVNANTGSITYTNIGTVGNPLNDVELTAASFIGTPANIHAATLNFHAPGTIVVNADVTSPGVAITYNAPVVVTADNITFSTCAGGAPITFNQSLDADSALNSRNIIINACGNSVTFNGPVGGIARLSSITLGAASDVNINSSMSTGSLTQTGGTGTTTIASNLDTDAAGGVNLQTSAITITGGIITTTGGSVVLNNSGALTISGSSLQLDGSFQQTGAGSVSVGGVIQTTDDLISFASDISLNSDLTLNTISSTGANISLAGAVDGAHNLTLAAGTGSISVGGNVGGVTPLSIFTVSSANNVDAAAVSAAAIVQTAGTGKTTFSGALSTTVVNGISLTGSQFEIDGAVTTTNKGPLLVNNSGAFTFSGGGTISGSLTQTGAGAVSLAGTTTAGAAVSFAAPVTLTGTTSLDTSANASNITFSSTLDGGQNLSLNLGSTGNLTFTGSVGGSVRLEALTIANGGNVASGSITAASITQTAGTGTSSFGSLNTNAVGGISLTGAGFSINGNLITTNSGPVAITNTGTLILVGGASTSITGAFSQGGGGSVGLAGVLLTVNQNLSFANAITLLGTTSLSTGAGTGTITLSSTVNGSQNLTLNAGTGNIVLGGAIGGTTALGALTVQSCTNITYPATSASSITQTASSGTTTLSSALTTTGTSGISLTGTTITQSSTLASSGNGPIAIINSGTYTMGGTVNAGGSFTQSGGGSVQLNGGITSSAGSISLANAITLTGSSSLSTNTGLGSILISSTIDGANNLSLTAGGGTITLSGAVGGGTRLVAFTINSGTSNTTGAITAASISQLSGSTTFGALNTNAVSGISLIGTSFTLGGNVTTTALGPVSIQNTGALVLSGPTFSIAGAFTQAGAGTTTLSSAITAGGAIQFGGPITASGGSLSTAVAGANISLLNTVDGGGNLTLDAGLLGDITIAGNVGSTTRLGALVFTNANNITVQNITAASLHQVNGQGTASYQAINTNAIGGIVKNGTNIIRNSSIVTTNGGPVHLTNSGTFTTMPGTTATVDGQYLQDGLGSVLIQGTITTNNQPISFAGPITLTDAFVLNTGAGAGDITFSNTVNGAFNLTLTAGTGSITASSPIGGVTRIGAFTVNSCTNFTGTGLTAASVSITETGGTVHSNGNINTNTAAGIVLNAQNIVRGGSVTATNGGPLTVTFSGTSTATGVFPINVGSLSITSTGVGAINFGGSVTTDTGGVDLNSPVNLQVPSSVNTSGPGGTIHFHSTVNGAQNMTLTAGAGNVLFDGVVGGTTPLSALLINSAHNVTALGAISAASIVQAAGTGTSTFSGALTTTGATGISITTASAVRGAAITTTGTGPLTFSLSPGGVLTSTAAGAISLDGAFTETGAASVFLSGSITTTNDNISFSSPITLAGTTTLNSGSGAGNISVASINGSQALNITAGTGDFTASGDFGNTTRLGALTVNSCTNFTVNGMTLASLNLTETGGTSTFNGILNTNTAAGITINAGNILQGGGVTATNGGPLTISFSGTNNATGIFVVQVGSLSITKTTVGSIIFGGSVITDTGGIDVHSPISFVATTSANTSGPGANIHFFDTVNGANNITLAAGTGNILFDAAVGGVTPPLTLTFSSANNITAAAAVSATAIVQTAGTGKTTFSGAVSTTTGAGISLTGSQFEIDGAVTTTNGGPLLVNNSGAFAFLGGGTIAGAFTQTGAGTVSLTGTTTAGGPVSFAAPVTLTGTTSLDTSANASNITFSGTLNGGQNLSVNLGTAGDLTFTGSVGGSTRLGALTIVNAETVASGSITAASITQTAGTGTSTFGSLNTNTIGGISLTGTSFSINGNLITTNLGPVAITNTGTLILAGGASTSITGAFSQSGGGSVGLAGLILTANQNLSFANAITLLGTTTLSSGTGAGTITLSSTVNGSQNLTLNAGTGNIVLGGAIGGTTALNALTVQSCANITYPATSASSITQTASSGTTTLSSALTTTGTAGISLTGTTITQSSTLASSGTGPIAIINSGTYTMGGTVNSGGSFTQSGGGPVQLNGGITSSAGSISLANAITLTGSSSLSTNTGLGSILVSSTIDGANNLSLTAGGGTITLSGAVGGGTRIGTFTINSGVSNTTGAITAASISQLSGSTTFGALNTNAVSGISLIGTSFTLGGNVTTTALGPVSIQNTGALVLSGPTFSIAGAFTQSGAGTTTLSSAIMANGPILFSGAAIASGSPSLDTSAAGQTITFLNTVNGPGGLSLNSGAGNITLGGALGGTTRLGAFVIGGANGVSTLGIRAASITQTMGTGTTSITGNLDTNALLGINLSSVNFTINGSLLSTNGGPCTISHTGLLTLNAGNSSLLSGPFTESGLGGTVTLSGSIHATNANVTFANPITLSGAATLNSNEGGDILISSTVDGPFDLVYTAGTGNITLAADIGGITPVTSLTITTAANVTTQAISSGYILQSTGTGLSQFNGVLTTTTASGIALTGNQFTFGAPVNTSGGGGAAIANAGLLTLPGVAPFSLDGAFSQTGAGSVSLCTTITTTGETISFASPVTLCGNAALDTSSSFGAIQFASTVDGARNLVLTAGQGNIVFAGNVGSITPLSLLQVNNCADFTAPSIHSGIIDIEGVSGLATCNGTLTTTNALGITLSGSAFTLNGNVTTSNAGPLAITNSGVLTIAPSLTLSLDGSFTQTGIGTTDIGGAITTNGQPITFSGPILLTGDLALNSGNGNITFGTGIEGAHSVTITAGTGDVVVPEAFSIATPLMNFTVVSAHDISLEGVGSNSAAMTGTLSLTASDTISLMGTLYSSHTQVYSSGADLDFINPGLMTLNTTGGPITFASASAHLNSGTDLAVNTNGGTFSFNAIHGTNFENLTINTGTGLASLGSLPNVGNINTVIVNAGQILLNGAMNLVNTDFTSLGSILNSGAPVDIVSANTASFNALGGNVGSLTSPILVHTQNQIYAGGIDLADFEGSSIDDTVHEIPSNPPCEIIWNGVVIKSCNRPNPPSPSPGPSSRIVFFGTPVPGVESSYFNLASDYYFMPFFLSDDYIRKPVLLFWRAPPPVFFAEAVNADY